jgi:hypothetical protein
MAPSRCSRTVRSEGNYTMVRLPYMLTTIAAAVLAGTYVLGTTPDHASADPKWRALLTPAAGSKVRGGAIAEARGSDSTRFTITIRDAAPDATYAWHMHSGTCASPGAVVGSGYPELHSGPGGTAEAAVTLPVAPPSSGSYLVQVHGPTGTPISCGELKAVGG